MPFLPPCPPFPPRSQLRVLPEPADPVPAGQRHGLAGGAGERPPAGRLRERQGAAAAHLQPLAGAAATQRPLANAAILQPLLFAGAQRAWRRSAHPMQPVPPLQPCHPQQPPLESRQPSDLSRQRLPDLQLATAPCQQPRSQLTTCSQHSNARLRASSGHLAPLPQPQPPWPSATDTPTCFCRPVRPPDPRPRAPWWSPCSNRTALSSAARPPYRPVVGPVMPTATRYLGGTLLATSPHALQRTHPPREP